MSEHTRKNPVRGDASKRLRWDDIDVELSSDSASSNVADPKKQATSIREPAELMALMRTPSTAPGKAGENDETIRTLMNLMLESMLDGRAKPEFDSLCHVGRSYCKVAGITGERSHVVVFNAVEQMLAAIPSEKELCEVGPLVGKMQKRLSKHPCKLSQLVLTGVKEVEVGGKKKRGGKLKKAALLASLVLLARLTVSTPVTAPIFQAIEAGLQSDLIGDMVDTVVSALNAGVRHGCMGGCFREGETVW